MVDVIRLLHRGDEVSHHGKHYEVQEARIHTRPEQPVPIYVSGFGPQGAELAGRIGDGFVLVLPEAELVCLSSAAEQLRDRRKSPPEATR